MKMRSEMSEYEVTILVLPNFKMESTFKLAKVLPKMAITAVIFSAQKADFNRMVADHPDNIAVPKVIHKAFVEVNEEGTRAAVANAGGVQYQNRFLVGGPPINFIADHPFLFLIQDNESGTIFFMGRFKQPTK